MAQPQPQNLTKAAAQAQVVADDGLFLDSLIEKRIVLPIGEINQNITENIAKAVKARFTGKCIEEGFVLPSSLQIVTTSSGKITNKGTQFVVAFRCKICNPPAGLVVTCTVTDITKAGIHAMCSVPGETDVKPISVYILRDHELKNERFEQVKKGDTISARILGARFELDDPCINAVAEF